MADVLDCIFMKGVPVFLTHPLYINCLYSVVFPLSLARPLPVSLPVSLLIAQYRRV